MLAAGEALPAARQPDVALAVAEVAELVVVLAWVVVVPVVWAWAWAAAVWVGLVAPD